MCVGPSRPGPLHQARTRGLPPATAPGPQVVPAHSVSAGLGELRGSVAQGKTCGPLCVREGFRFPGHEPRDPVNLA